MPSFQIGIELGDILPSGTPLAREAFPTLAFAVRRMVDAAHERWVSYAEGMPLPSGLVIQARSGEYARSIQTRDTGDFSGEVFSELPYAAAIEEGMPERDLKKMLSSSLKVRLTKNGRRYLIIPFRWNGPNSVMGRNMPVDVSNWWKSDERVASHITGTFERLSGTGAFDIRTRKPITVPGRTYSWGSRIKTADLHAMGMSARDPVNRRYLGMVNFRKPGGSGGGAHSQFLTFRVMMEGSKGWIAPAQPGKWPARTVTEQLRPVAEEAFRRAAEADVRNALGQVL